MHRPVVVVVAIAALLFALVPAPQAAGADPGTPRSPDRRLIERLDPERLSLHAETGWVRFLGGSTAKPLRVAGGAAEPLTAADAFLGTYGPLFGLTDPGAELRARPTRNPVDRLSVVRFDQLYQGIPVLAGELAVQVDKKGAVLAASGEISPDLGLDIVPVLTADQAAAEAISASATANGVAASTLDATPPTLAIYDPRLLGSPGLPVPRLVWRTDVGSAGGISVRDFVAVDAMRGGIALIFSDLETALERRICDRNNTRNDASCTGPYVRVEGGPASGIADADAAYDFLGDAYAFYASRFGRDSVDNAGLPIVATVRFCTTDASEGCPYQNAYWDGSVDQLFFGAGYLVDDVTAHELSHGVTHFESRFYYVYQSGALSEMMSDVFGEFVDLTNGRGNDSPSARWLIGEEMAGGAIRNMANPPAYNQPDRMRSSLYYSQGPADDDHDNGGVHYNSGVGNKAAYLLTDGGTFNGHVVGSIGLDKTARIFYVANTTLLTSGSDYADLYDDLQQACTASIGTAGITSGDCVQVGEAVAATEMNLQPTTGAAAPEAPVCAASVSPVALFSDDFEAGGANWVSGTITGGNAWEPIPDHMYATSGTHHLWGINLPVTADSYAAMKTAVPVPAGQPYLRFAHAYEFHTADASNRAGGVVEYTVNNGTTWLDAGPLVVDNPYNGTIAAGYGNPLAGREGFTRWSYGYTSSRLSLASLVGQTVRFRFRVGTDVSGGALGWLIDDVRIYNCDTTPPSNTAPTISNIPDQTTPVNTAEGPLAFTVGDAETDPGSLDVTGSSSNTTLVPNASITFGGSGASRTVTVTPATGQVGTATITVTVSDGDLTAQDTFVQTVTPTSTECPPDDAYEPNNSRGTATPLTSGQGVAGIACDDDYFSIAAVAGQTITADLTFVDADGDLDMRLQNSTGAQVASSASVTDNEHLDYDVTQSGTYYVWVYPYNGAANQNSYGLTVTVPPPSNTAPTISNIPDQTTPVNTAEGPLAFTVGDAETDPGSLIVTGSSSNTTLVPNASITFGGADASRTVTVTPATGQVGTATITVTVSDGDLTAQDTFVQTVTPTDTGITATGVGVSYAKFYPYKDGYRDTVAIRGTPGEPLSVTVKVYNGAGKKVRSWSLASRTDPWSISWNGKNASGTRLPAGKYKVTQALRDEPGNTRTYTSYTTISNKRLYWSTASITKNGNQLSAYGDPGSGSVSVSKSSYSRGVLLTSGTSWVAVRYSFTLRAAKIYEPLRFKVLGRSPNGRTGQEGLWNSTYGSSNDVGAYDRKTIGPGYRWYTIKGASSTHRSGRSTCGLVYVEYLGGTQKFDVSKVRLAYRYAVLR